MDSKHQTVKFHCYNQQHILIFSQRMRIWCQTVTGTAIFLSIIFTCTFLQEAGLFCCSEFSRTFLLLIPICKVIHFVKGHAFTVSKVIPLWIVKLWFCNFFWLVWNFSQSLHKCQLCSFTNVAWNGRTETYIFKKI